MENNLKTLRTRLKKRVSLYLELLGVEQKEFIIKNYNFKSETLTIILYFGNLKVIHKIDKIYLNMTDKRLEKIFKKEEKNE